jgi:hypothetical protein
MKSHNAQRRDCPTLCTALRVDELSGKQKAHDDPAPILWQQFGYTRQPKLNYLRKIEREIEYESHGE